MGYMTPPVPLPMSVHSPAARSSGADLNSKTVARKQYRDGFLVGLTHRRGRHENGPSRQRPQRESHSGLADLTHPTSSNNAAPASESPGESKRLLGSCTTQRTL